MTRLLLDTTFLVDTERAGLDVAIPDDADVAIAAVTVAELLVGIELATGRRRQSRRAFVDDLVGSVPVLPYDLGVVAAHSILLASVRKSGRPRGAHDLMIAATAVAADRMIVSADERGFTGLPGVRVYDHRRE